MSQRQWMLSCLVFSLLLGLANDAWAYKKESRVGLQGCNGYFSASGDAKYIEARSEKKQKDYDELFVELKNVPTAPGTTLLVYVDDHEVGKIVLNEKRGGVLRVNSQSVKNIPRIEAGTSVHIKTTEGRLVLK